MRVNKSMFHMNCLSKVELSMQKEKGNYSIYFQIGDLTRRLAKN